MIIVMMVLIITDSIASVLEETGVTLMEFKPHAHLWDFLDLGGIDTDTQPRPLTLPVYPPSSPYEYNFTKREHSAHRIQEMDLAFSVCLLRQLPRNTPQTTEGTLFLNGISMISYIQAP